MKLKTTDNQKLTTNTNNHNKTTKQNNKTN